MHNGNSYLKKLMNTYMQNLFDKGITNYVIAQLDLVWKPTDRNSIDLLGISITIPKKQQFIH